MVINVTECNKDSIAQQPDPNGKILAIFFFLPFLCVQFYISRKSKHEHLTGSQIKKLTEGSLVQVPINYSCC